MNNSVKLIERVRFSECDSMGVVHHSRYFTWLEEARIELTKLAEIDFIKLSKENVHFPLITSSCKYHKFAYYGDEIVVMAELEYPKFAKLIFNYKVYRTRTMELLLTATTSHAIMTPDKGVLLTIPQDMRAGIEKMFDV